MSVDLSTREDQCWKRDVPKKVAFHDTVEWEHRGVNNKRPTTNDPANQTKKGKLSIVKTSANRDSESESKYWLNFLK